MQSELFKHQLQHCMIKILNTERKKSTQRKDFIIKSVLLTAICQPVVDESEEHRARARVDWGVSSDVNDDRRAISLSIYSTEQETPKLEMTVAT